ncbi:MAG: tRNA (N(6)-L-threonylcarbamoyladenosine(37)-C(2))-methylthiotransferase MtaB [Phycisphaerales bacterium]|nr:MAG: tRNA (N(6)-L-threonylcarbamoyladenosine(37)-C(2))-methylthiotransferase MtaB [Phycisphaerales bacterium]
MKSFSINTLGCKVNQYESQQIRELLEQLGLRQAETSEKADFAVVNTCCVTHTASAKSRQHIRKTQNLNPQATLVVCGCLPAIAGAELSGLGQDCRLITHKDDVAGTLIQLICDRATAENSKRNRSEDTSNDVRNTPNTRCGKRLGSSPQLPQLVSFQGHTRAFLKIQDGCDGYCTYCIIPKARPQVHSKPAEAVLAEATALVRAGHREIVLTGIFLGAYGQDSVRQKTWPKGQNHKLAELLDEMAEIPDLARIRLSSLEPADVTPRLLDTFCKHRNIMPHLHLSLQSGSDAVLRRMCRQYTADEFRLTTELIEARLDRPAITTDIIVGFPGETEADFEQTVMLAEEVEFAKIHVFAFSPRKGTAAAKMQDAVPNRVVKERSGRLRELDAQLQRRFRERFIGETAEVLLENKNGQVSGRSERYFLVHLKEPEEKLQSNQLVTVRLVQNREDAAVGEPASTA